MGWAGVEVEGLVVVVLLGGWRGAEVVPPRLGFWGWLWPGEGVEEEEEEEELRL